MNRYFQSTPKKNSFTLKRELLGLTIILLMALNSPITAKELRYQPSKFPQADYIEHGYEWENNTIGISSDVPLPWTNLIVEEKAVKVWGRTYLINQSNSLLDQIKTQGKDILTNSIRLDGVINGEIINRHNIVGNILENEKNSFKRKTIIKNNSYEVIIDKSVEFDGFVRFDISIIPKTKITIDKFQIVIPIKKNFAKYFSHFLPYDYIKQRSDRKNIFKSSGIINKSFKLSFTPAIWIGNSSTGIELINETNVNDYPNDKQHHSISITRSNNTTFLKRHFISKRLTSSEPLTYSFALIATPTKPKMKNWRNIYFTGSQKAKQAINIPKNNECRDILFFGNYTTTPLQYPGLPLPPLQTNLHDYNRYKSDRKILKKNNIKYIPYSALYILPSTIKELKDYRKLWSTVPPRKGAFYWTMKLGVEKPIQPVIYEHRSIRDYLVHMFTSQIEKNDIDGVYFDAATISQLKNITQYRFGKKLKVQYYPMYSHRETLKRFWIATKALKPNFKIIHHATKPPHFASAFSDIVITGEELNLFFRGGKNKTKIKYRNKKEVLRFINQENYKPNYHNIPKHFFFTSLNQGDGYVAMLLPQVKKFNSDFLSSNNKVYKNLTKNIIATSLMYDIPLWRTRIEHSVINEVDSQIIASSCIADKSHKLLFPIIIHPQEMEEYIEVTMHNTNNGTIIMSVYNNSLTKKEFVIQLPRKIDIDYSSKNTVVTTGNTSFQQSIENDSIKIKLAQQDLLMFTLKPKKLQKKKQPTKINTSSIHRKYH